MRFGLKYICAHELRQLRRSRLRPLDQGRGILFRVQLHHCILKGDQLLASRGRAVKIVLLVEEAVDSPHHLWPVKLLDTGQGALVDRGELGQLSDRLLMMNSCELDRVQCLVAKLDIQQLHRFAWGGKLLKQKQVPFAFRSRQFARLHQVEVAQAGHFLNSHARHPLNQIALSRQPANAMELPEGQIERLGCLLLRFAAEPFDTASVPVPGYAGRNQQPEGATAVPHELSFPT